MTIAEFLQELANSKIKFTLTNLIRGKKGTKYQDLCPIEALHLFKTGKALSWYNAALKLKISSVDRSAILEAADNYGDAQKLRKKLLEACGLSKDKSSKYPLDKQKELS